MAWWIKNSSAREALLGTLVFLLGWGWFHSAKEHAKEVPTVGCNEHVQVVQQHDVQTVEHTNTIVKIQTRVQRPDGTVVVQQKIIENTAKVFEKSSDKSLTVTDKVAATPPKPSYSLGVNYLPAVSRKPAPTDVEVEAGARIGQSNWWVVTGVDVKDKQLKVGIRFDF